MWSCFKYYKYDKFRDKLLQLIIEAETLERIEYLEKKIIKIDALWLERNVIN